MQGLIIFQLIKIYVKIHFNINFNVSFNSCLEQSSCVFSWINKRCDNIKMHGKTVKIIKEDVLFSQCKQ